MYEDDEDDDLELEAEAPATDFSAQSRKPKLDFSDLIPKGADRPKERAPATSAAPAPKSRPLIDFSDLLPAAPAAPADVPLPRARPAEAPQTELPPPPTGTPAPGIPLPQPRPASAPQAPPPIDFPPPQALDDVPLSKRHGYLGGGLFGDAGALAPEAAQAEQATKIAAATEESRRATEFRELQKKRTPYPWETPDEDAKQVEALVQAGIPTDLARQEVNRFKGGGDRVKASITAEKEVEQSAAAARSAPLPTRTITRNLVENFTKSLSDVTVATGAGGVRAASYPFGYDNAGHKLADWIGSGREVIKEALPGDMSRQGDLAPDVAGGLGSSVPFAATAIAAATLGLPAGAATALIASTGALSQGEISRAEAAEWLKKRDAELRTFYKLDDPELTGAARRTAQEAFDRARNVSADDLKLLKVFLVNGAMGTTEAVPIANALERLNHLSGGGVMRVAKAMGFNSVEEALQEGAQQFVQNATEQLVYNPEKLVGDGVERAMVVAGIAGAIQGGMIQGAGEIKGKLSKRGIEGRIPAPVEPAPLDMTEAAPPVSPTAGPASPSAGEGAPQPPKGNQPAQPAAQPLPAEPVPEGNRPAVSATERRTLRKLGYTDENIDGMNRAEVAAELGEAAEQGVEPEPTEKPSAEPASDILAQLKDMQEGNRQAVWLPKATIEHLRSTGQLKELRAAIGNGQRVTDFDGQGGMLVARDHATGSAAIAERDAGGDMQEIIGRLTGDGTGKPPGADTVVQQTDAQGNVTRERLAADGEVPAVAEDFKAPGRDVDVVPAADALTQRAEKVAAEAEGGARTFRTAKGSTYTVHEDGTTTRVKAARSDPGHEGDSGAKPRTAKTYYVDAADAPKFNPPDSAKWRIIDHADGTLSLATLRDDGKWGISPSDRNIPVQTSPRVGLSPVELWKPDKVYGLDAYAGVHPGNAITEIGDKATSAAIDFTDLLPDGSRARPAKVTDQADIERAAAKVAEEPTPAQQEAENYRAGHVRWPGLGRSISIETKKGGTRRASDRSWEVTDFPAHYGRIKGTIGADGQQVDAFMGDEVNAPNAFVIDQYEPKTGRWDEHKVMLGFTDAHSAAQTYDAAFSDGSGPLRRGAITPISVKDLRKWLRRGKRVHPFSGPKEIPVGQAESTVARKEPDAGIRRLAERGGPLPESEQSGLPQLRRPGDQAASGVGGELPGVSGGRGTAPESQAHARPDQEREGVRAGQHALGDAEGAGAQHAQKPSADIQGQDADADGVGRGDRVGAIDAPLPAGSGRDDGRGGSIDGSSRRPETTGSVADARKAVDDALAALGIPPEAVDPADVQAAAQVVAETGADPAQAFQQVMAEQITEAGNVDEPEAVSGGVEEAPSGRGPAESKQHARRGEVRPEVADQTGEGGRAGEAAEPGRPDNAAQAEEAQHERPGDTEKAEDAGVAAKGTTLADTFVTHLREGGEFKNILVARKMAKEAGFETDAKAVEEALELAVVKLAREIVADRSDPKANFTALVDLYSRQPKLGTRTSTSMRDQAFSTPIPLAYVASRLARASEGWVLEPTAGNGALLIEVDPKEQSTTINEFNGARAKNLTSQGFRPTGADASEPGVFDGEAKKVDVVLTNPPFGTSRQEGESKVFDLSDIQSGYRTREIDHAIVHRALQAMRDRGRAVLIIGGLNKLAQTQEARSDGYNGKAKREFFKTLYDRYNVTDHFTVAGELYERQGAGWPVDVIVIDGRGKSQRALPAVDVPRVLSSWDQLGGLIDGLSDRGDRATDRPADGAGRAGSGERDGRDRGDGRRDAGPVESGEVQQQPVQRPGDESAGGKGRASARDERGDAERTGAQPDAEQPSGGITAEQAVDAALDKLLGAPAAPKSSSEPVVAPEGYELSALSRVPKRLAEIHGGEFTAVASRQSPFSAERGYGNTPEEAQRDALRRIKAPAPETGTKYVLPSFATSQYVKPRTARRDTRTTGEVAKSAVENFTGSADDALSALTQMFGGGKTINMGVPFTPENYAKAKPLLTKAAEKFSEFKNDIMELAQRLVDHLRDTLRWTNEAIADFRPFLIQFIKDVQSGAVSLTTEPKAAPKPAAPVTQEQETDKQVAYVAKSGSQGLGTLVPVNMRSSISEALTALEKRVGPLDTYVATELDYKTDKNGSPYFIREGETIYPFAAEQIDAIALGIENIERGKGFIIGDQTGIGKGRVNAGILRYAIQKGYTPIFVTAQQNLYGDMYRDLTDIGIQEMLGHDLRILATNNSTAVPLTEEDKPLMLRTGDSTSQKVIFNKTDARNFKDSHDVIFTTYNQMQTVQKSDTARRAFLHRMASGAIIAFDESHNAGGQGKNTRKGKNEPDNRSDFARDLIEKAKGVFYSSATYAKRPDVMDLYSATDMSMAVENKEDLGEAIAKGGVPMQQAVASMLAKAGQYIRRERSFAGVDYHTPIIPTDHELYDQISGALAAIQKFSVAMQKPTSVIDGLIKGEAEAIAGDNAVGEAGATSTLFTSIMHNVINQMLLALKARPSAAMAIEALKRGEKPVLTLANTMESFLKDYADLVGIKTGDPIDANFGTVLSKYLERTRTIIIKKPFSKDPTVRKYLTDAELGPDALSAYNAAKAQIEAADMSALPASPIDRIKQDIINAGYTVGEITGRGTIIDYSGDEPILRNRPGGEMSITGRRQTLHKFNAGPIDAMILNQAGSTGLSAHASAKYQDQRQRHMMIVQPEANIDTHMQMLGRVHRTGQVIVPIYSQLVADIPAEKRPAAVLAKKMASLNANTTASRGGALTAKDVPDFMNQYGDMVAAAIIADDHDLFVKLARPKGLIDEETGRVKVEGAMGKVTGRIPLLPLEEQEALYGRLEADYESLIQQMDAAGENALEAKTLDLKARPIERTEVVPAKSGLESPFAAPVHIEKTSIVRQGKPFSEAELLTKLGESLDQNLEGERAGDVISAVEDGRGTIGQGAVERQRLAREEAVAEFEDYRRKAVDFIEDRDKATNEFMKLKVSLDRWAEIHEMLLPGTRVTLLTGSGNKTAVVLKTERTGEAKNPLALSSWKATFAIADAERQVMVPFSRLFMEGKSSSEDQATIELRSIGWVETPAQTVERFASMQTSTREERFIATGNLLAAYDWLNMKGRIINYTDEQGHIRQGILTSKEFDLEKQYEQRARPMRDPAEIIAYMRKNKGEPVWSEDNAVRLNMLYDKDLYVTVEAYKRKGGVFFLDKPLTGLTGDFYKRGGTMVANMQGASTDKITQVIERFQALGATFVDRTEAKAPAAEKMGDEVQSFMGWHGSPHDHDRFSNDKIGTGEGAQSYGWGLYFAGKRDVAEYYRDRLARPDVLLDGKVPTEDSVAKTVKSFKERDVLIDFVQEVYDGRVRSIEGFRDQIGEHETDWESLDENYEFKIPPRLKAFDRLVDSGRLTLKPKAGKLYTVNVNAEIDHMLDWDKPMSQQSEHVKKVLRASGITSRLDPELDVSELPGGKFYEEMARVLGGERMLGQGDKQWGPVPYPDDKAASQKMREAGIPGIKYLDQDSRNAGDGTHNYVVFDDKLIEITEKKSLARLRQSPGAQQHRGRLEEQLSEIVERIVGRRVAIRFEDRIPIKTDDKGWGSYAEGKDSAAGSFSPTRGLIRLALADPRFAGNERSTAYHEAFHAVEYLLWNEQGPERAVLARERDRLENWILGNMDFGPGGITKAELQQMAGYEIRAMAFEGYAQRREQGQSTGGIHIAIRRGFERLMEILRRIRNYLQRYGYRTSEDVFAAVYEGRTRAAADRAERSTMQGAAEAADRGERYSLRRRAAGPGDVIPAPETFRGAMAQMKPFKERLSDAIDAILLTPARSIWDRQIDLLRFQKGAEAVGSPVPESLDTYLAASLYPGRSGERMKDVSRDLWEPVYDAMRDHSISRDDLQDYLYARHAPERNAAIRTIDPTNDAGSGMTDTEAADIMGRLLPRRDGFEAVATLIDQIVAHNRATMLREGLESERTLDAWGEAYQHYVPLKGFEAGSDDEIMPSPATGRGFDIRRPESYRALGRFDRADDILANLFDQTMRTVIRSEKNRVAKTFLRFAQANPSPYYKIGLAERKRRINPLTGMVEEYWANLPTHLDRVFAAKVGGKTYYIEIKHDGLLQALKTLGMTKLPLLLRLMMRLTREYSRLQTAKNPEFVLRNFEKDIQDATLNISAEQRERYLRRFFVNLPKAFAGAVVGTAERGEGTQVRRWFEEWRQAGGKISFYGFQDIEQIQQEIEKELRQRTESTGKSVALALPRLFDPINGKLVKLLEKLSDVTESTTRLAVYMAGRDIGLSRAQAAAMSRNATVDFNRRGHYGHIMSAFYAFSGANIQGNVNTMRRLRKSKTMRRAAYALVVAGMLVTFWNMMVSPEDDEKKRAYEKLKYWQREKNIHIYWPGAKRPLKLPTGFVLVPFWMLGENLAMMMLGKISKTEAIGNYLGTVVDAFNPMGSQGSFLDLERWARTITPTVVRPVTELPLNRNWAGNKIRPDEMPWTKHLPHSEQHKAFTNPYAIASAEWINRMTGGNKFEPGAISPYPDDLQYMWDFALGGLGRFMNNTSKAIADTIDGVDVPPDRMPFVRNIVGPDVTDQIGEQESYYKKRTEEQAKTQRLRAAIKSRSEGTDDGSADAVIQRLATETGARPSKSGRGISVPADTIFRSADTQIKELRKQEDAIRKDERLTRSARKGQIDDLRKQMREIMGQARARVPAPAAP